jgi:hypothetical protein
MVVIAAELEDAQEDLGRFKRKAEASKAAIQR